MIAFVIAACLSSDPTQCEQTVLSWWPKGEILACREAIEPAVVLWSRDNRDRVVTAAYCLPGRPGQG